MWNWVLSFLISLLVTCRPPAAANAANAANAPNAPTPDPAKDPCAIMRHDGDASKASTGAWPHLVDRRLEAAVRRFYTVEVLGRGFDDRSLAQHPLVLERGVTAAGIPVQACVDVWRADDPSGGLPGGSGRFFADHRYVEVSFEFNDASDGEWAYTVFVDEKTLEVVAGFAYDNFQP